MSPRRRDALLDLARRLAAPPPPYLDEGNGEPHRPTGKLLFDEFLLQWACEIDLPHNLPNDAFIAEAFCAVLLRRPTEAEMQRYLRRSVAGISQAQLIEDFLASPELRRLERKLRVRVGDDVIVDPARPEAMTIPAVRWPPRESQR